MAIRMADRCREASRPLVCLCDHCSAKAAHRQASIDLGVPVTDALLAFQADGLPVQCKINCWATTVALRNDGQSVNLQRQTTCVLHKAVLDQPANQIALLLSESAVERLPTRVPDLRHAQIVSAHFCQLLNHPLTVHNSEFEFCTDRPAHARKSCGALPEHWFGIITLMIADFKLRTAIGPESKRRSVWKAAWKVATISGGVLTLLFYGFNGLYAYSHLHVRLPQFWLLASLTCVLVGISCLAIGQIGWAILAGESGRARITAFGFAFPVFLAFIGYLSAGDDPHGSFPIFYLPLAPLIVVAVILVWIW
jgi:hypothetical protein